MFSADLRNALMDVAAKAIAVVVILSVSAALLAVNWVACEAGQAWVSLATFMAVPLLVLAATK